MRINHRPNLAGTTPGPDQAGTAFHGHRTAAAESTPLVFVTGASRSGTTMLARMLGAHSSILACNELHYFGSLWDPQDTDLKFSDPELVNLAAVLLARQTRGLWSGRPTDVEQNRGRRLVRDLSAHDRTGAGLFAAVLRHFAEDAGKAFACEQTPRNIFYAKQLLALYPNARIVHLVRDPRAVLASQKNRWKLRRLGAHHLPASEMLRNRVNYHPLTISKLWASATEEAMRLDGHARFMVVRFEDLAHDPQGGAQRLCSFLDLRYEPGMLELPRWGSSNLEHTSAQLGISVEVVDKWREHLSAGEALICEKITHHAMQHFHYPIEFLGRHSTLSAIPSLAFYPLHVAGVVTMNPGRAWIQLKALVRSRRTSHGAVG